MQHATGTNQTNSFCCYSFATFVVYSLVSSLYIRYTLAQQGLNYHYVALNKDNATTSAMTANTTKESSLSSSPSSSIGKTVSIVQGAIIRYNKSNTE